MNSNKTQSFKAFFKAATGNSPYDWQCRLAEQPECESRLIDIPTGLGKTAGVVLAWLWNLRSQFVTLNEGTSQPTKHWPRRLVYCLPMRTLVEQTRDEVSKWLTALETEDLLPGKRPRVVVLMGGEDLSPEAKDWDLYPEEPAILIGTQDMLLSRALNRGYPRINGQRLRARKSAVGAAEVQAATNWMYSIQKPVR